LKDKLRMAVVGLGFIGEPHTRIVHELPNTELVAVSDINESFTTSASKRYNCAGYTNYKEMIDKEQIDAISITVPDEYHAEIAIYAADKGLDVLLEKPIAHTIADSQKIIDRFNGSKERLMIAHTLHFDPRYVKLKESVHSGELGELIHLFFKRTNPRHNPIRLGGKVTIFHYIGIHDFDMLCACAQSKPIRAYCQEVRKVHKDRGCEDSIFAIVNFENGALGVVELCWALPNNPALVIPCYAEVVGVNAVAYLEIMNQGVTVVNENSLWYPDTIMGPEYNGRIYGILRDEIEHFAAATLRGEPYIVDTQNAFTALKVVDACRKSIQTGLPVDI